MRCVTLYSPEILCIMGNTKHRRFATLIYEEDKNMKKLIALALAMVLALTVCTVFAEEETITLKETDGDWTLRAVKEGEEPDSVTISMADGTEYNITASSEGATEIATEDESTVITTVNDLYLPEEAYRSIRIILKRLY